MTGRVKRDFAKESWDEYYRRYQSVLAEKYLIPLLRRWDVLLAGKRFLEAGSGDGGCSAAFHGAGCRVFSMDIDERLVGIADELNRREGLDIEVFHGNVVDEETEAFRKGPFDIILLRDVIEHIAEPTTALRTIKRQLSDEGVIFVVFPPYYSPYGAHQQTLPRKKFRCFPFNKLPYIQLLPDRFFLALINGDAPQSREVKRLRGIRLTLKKFENFVAASGLRIRFKKLYLLRPTFSLRYGIPAAGAAFFGQIPFLNELIITGAYYLLENARPDDRLE